MVLEQIFEKKSSLGGLIVLEKNSLKNPSLDGLERNILKNPSLNEQIILEKIFTKQSKIRWTKSY